MWSRSRQTKISRRQETIKLYIYSSLYQKIIIMNGRVAHTHVHVSIDKYMEMHAVSYYSSCRPASFSSWTLALPL